MSRKPRSDSKLLTLPTEQQVIIFGWMKHGVSYTKIRLKIKSEFGITTSEAALTPFWVFWSGKESKERILRAVTGADAILEHVGETLPKLDKAMEVALKQAAFEASLSKDTKELKNLVDVFLKIQRAEMDEKALNLQVDRFEFSAAKAALAHVATLKAIQSDKGMSQSEKVDAVRRQLFSVLPEDAR